MPATYEPISTVTVGTATASVTFSSIPGTYTDLRLVITETNAAAATPVFTFNGDTGSNYSRTGIFGNTSAVVTYQDSNATSISPQETSFGITTRPNYFIMDLFSYAGSTFKTVLLHAVYMPSATGNSRIERIVGLYRSTSAITSLTHTSFSGTDLIQPGSRLTLFGIKAA